MSSSIYKVNETGTDTISFSATVPVGYHYRLVSVSCGFLTTPTTSENFTVTLDAHAGTAYNVYLYVVDPAASAVDYLMWFPDEEVILEGGDQVDVAYANTDKAQYGCQITLKRV